MRARARRIGGGQRAAATDAACVALLALAELRSAGTVALYAAFADEVPLGAVAARLRARGVRTVYPRGAAAGLELAIVTDERELARGAGGFGQPGPTAPAVAVHEVDVFVVPGLLFDRACRRIGRGGGDYDRLLARARPDAARVGICYADRVVDELPEDPWDVAMNVVVTERLTLRPIGAGPR